VEQVKLPGDASYKVAHELYRQHSKTDSLLIQERWRSVAYIQELEDDTQKTALSSTAASLWVAHARSWNQSPDPGLR
jgi:maleate cis-trans isomerase